MVTFRYEYNFVNKTLQRSLPHLLLELQYIATYKTGYRLTVNDIAVGL